MAGITEAAANRLIEDQYEFVHVIGTMRGDKIYEAGFTIAVHSKVFDMFYNNEFNCDYLSELILCNENPIVNIITADYVLAEYKDFTNLKDFVKAKIDELHPQ